MDPEDVTGTHDVAGRTGQGLGVVAAVGSWPRDVAVDVYLYTDFTLIMIAGTATPLLVAPNAWLTPTTAPTLADEAHDAH